MLINTIRLRFEYLKFTKERTYLYRVRNVHKVNDRIKKYFPEFFKMCEKLKFSTNKQIQNPKSIDLILVHLV